MGNYAGRALVAGVVLFLVSSAFQWMPLLDDRPLIGATCGESMIVDPAGNGNYTSIQAAIDNASAGDTIYIWNGTYNECVVVDKTLTIIGNYTWNTSIDGGKTGHVMEIRADWVNVTGLTLYNSATSGGFWGDSGIHVTDAGNISIDHVRSTSNGVGISIINSRDVRVNDSLCSLNLGAGIYILNGSRNTIYNNTLTQCYWGLYIGNGSDENTVSHNVCSECGTGVWLLGYSDGNDVINNSIADSSLGIELAATGDNYFGCNRMIWNSEDIEVGWSNGGTFEDNECKLGGFTIDMSEGLTLRNNNVKTGVNITGFDLKYWSSHDIDDSNLVNDKPPQYIKHHSGQSNLGDPGQVILVNCTDRLVKGFEAVVTLAYCDNIAIEDNRGPIRLYESSHCSLDNNTGLLRMEKAHNNTVSMHEFIASNWGRWPEDMAILEECHDNVLDNCTFHYSEQDSIRLWKSHRNTIRNTSCQYSAIGIRLFSSDGCRLIDNLYECVIYSAIHLQRSHYNLLSGNRCQYNEDTGIYLLTSHNNIIENNNLSGNLNGLSIYLSDNNHIFENDFLFHDGTGIWVEGEGNRFFHNNIYDNANVNQAYMNFWDNGEGEGNYWDLWTTSDDGTDNRTRGDGISDIYLPAFGLDNYPFVDPSGWEYPGRVRVCGPEVDYDGNFTVYWAPAARATHYQLWEVIHGGDEEEPAVIYEGQSTSFDITNRKVGEYFYEVCSFKGENVAGSWDDLEVEVVTEPPVPPDFTAVPLPMGNANNISWSLDPIFEPDWHIDFELYYWTEGMDGPEKLDLEEISMGYITVPDFYYHHTGLEDGKEYQYWLHVWDEWGNYTNTSIKTSVPWDIEAPAPVTELVIDHETKHELTIMWDAPPEYDTWDTFIWNSTWDEKNYEIPYYVGEYDVTGYNLYRNSSGDPVPVRVNNETITGTSFTDNDLLDGTNYTYYVTVVDEVPNESAPSVTINGTTERACRVRVTYRALMNVTIEEDEWDDDAIDLRGWFENIRGEPLYYDSDRSRHIDVMISWGWLAGQVTLVPVEDWSGQEQIAFTVSDGVFEVEWKVNVTVMPVNDLPGPVEILSPEMNETLTPGDSVDLIGKCSDPDMPYGDALTFNWSSDLSGPLGEGETIRDIILPAGDHVITLKVIDIAGDHAFATVNITVESPPDVADGGDGDTNITDDSPGTKEGGNGALIAGVVAVAVIIMVILAILLYTRIRRLKKREEADGEGEDEVVMIGEEDGEKGFDVRKWTPKSTIMDASRAYAVLALEDGASREEVKERYRELAKEYHPDKLADLDDVERLKAEKLMMRVNEAYGFLKEELGSAAVNRKEVVLKPRVKDI